MSRQGYVQLSLPEYTDMIKKEERLANENRLLLTALTSALIATKEDNGDISKIVVNEKALYNTALSFFNAANGEQVDIKNIEIEIQNGVNRQLYEVGTTPDVNPCSEEVVP
jgi:hypothetical protein